MSLTERRSVVQRLLTDRSDVVADYRSMVELLRRRGMTSSEDGELYLEAVSQLSVDELTLHDVVMIARNHRAPLRHADSFFRKIVERRRKKQLGAVPEKYLGHSKKADVQFAESAGVPVPATLWAGRISDIPQSLKAGTFLKPTKSSGAKGAFYLFCSDNLFSVHSSKQLQTWDELLIACRKQMAPQSADEITWELQELVQEYDHTPARDLKFFAFYGQVGLVQEVLRHPVKQYEFFNADGSLADCGRDRTYEPRFLDPEDTITDKGGLTMDKLETAQDLSLQIPAPFMRIDFLNGAEGLLFCEFSSSPGMSHTFNEDYDQRLGRMYLEAEMRLADDLLAGKPFEAFTSWRAALQLA